MRRIAITTLFVTWLGSPAMAWAGDAPDKKPVMGGLDLQVYGYVRVDAAFDTARAFPGNYVLWVKSEETVNDDNQLNITANQTRVGLNIAGPEIPGLKTGGKVEFDFYGGGMENKSNVMLRQAYAEFSMPDWDFSVLAGQTWDVLSPLNPDTLNYPVNGYAGDLGYRRPLIRLSKNFAMSEKSRLACKVVAARNLGRSVAVSETESGGDAALPNLQAALAWSGPLLTAQPALLGASASWAREEVDRDTGGATDIYPSWAFSLEALLPLAETVAVKGNVWKGANLESFFGNGTGQGINTATGEAVATRGGWVSLALGPFAAVKFNAGASIELLDYNQVPDAATPAKSWRYQNSAMFVNALYNLTPAAQIGLEVAQWRTLYKQIKPGDSLRLQMAVTYTY